MRKSRLIVLLLVCWGLLVLHMSAPYFGVQDAFRVWIAASVRNIDYYGAEATGLMMTRNSAPAPVEDLNVYSHHPPSVTWVPALTTIPIGFNEVGVRFGFIAATMLSIAAMYVLTRRLFNDRIAWWATAFYALVPMLSYMGRVPGYAQLSLAVALIFAAVLVNWLRQPTRARLIALLVLTWVAVWTAWSAVFFIGALGFVAMILGNKQQRIAVFGMGVLSVVAFVTLMLFYESQHSGSIESIMDAFIWRSSDVAARRGSASLSWGDYVARFFTDLFLLVTPGIIVMSVLGIIPARKYGNRNSLLMLFGLFLAGMSYQLVFRNASHVHDYYKTFLVPAMAISGAIAWQRYRLKKPPRRFIKPAMDGLLLGSVITGVGVFAILHYSGHQPAVQAIIETVNAEAQDDDTLIGYFNYPGYATSDGYNRVVEFYTFRNLAWDMPPAEVIDMATTSDSRILYVFCHNPEYELTPEQQQAWDDLALLAAYPSETIYEDTCTLYRIEPQATQ